MKLPAPRSLSEVGPNFSTLVRKYTSTPVFLLVLLISCVLVLFSAPEALAYEDEGAGFNLQTEFEETISSGQTSLEESIFESTIGIVKSGNVMLWACQAANCPPEYRFGAINTVGTMIAGIYANPPVSGITYLADVSSRLSPVKPAYAQAAGTGFDALRPVLKIWRGFRNFAYALFVIIFVAIGFAIMFRLQISPQTVITIQSALPRIIVALILVTFSYAIAGFMIDLLYLIMALAILVIGGAAGLNTAELQTQFLQGNFLTALVALNQLMPAGMFIALPALGALVGAGLGALSGILIPTSVITLPGLAIGAGLGALVGFLVIGIFILYVLFKLFIELVKAYFGIILAVILAPLHLLLGALPLQGVGFASWFKGLFVNILIFPAVASILLIGRAIGDSLRQPGGQIWSAPLVGGGDTAIVGAIIALGALLVVHHIPNAIRQAFKTQPFLGAAVGQTLAGPLGLAQMGIGGMAGTAIWRAAAAAPQSFTARALLQIARLMRFAPYEAPQPPSTRVKG